MPGWSRQSGVWRPVGEPSGRLGSWRAGQDGFVRDDGAYKQWYSSGFPFFSDGASGHTGAGTFDFSGGGVTDFYVMYVYRNNQPPGQISGWDRFYHESGNDRNFGLYIREEDGSPLTVSLQNNTAMARMFHFVGSLPGDFGVSTREESPPPAPQDRAFYPGLSSSEPALYHFGILFEPVLFVSSTPGSIDGSFNLQDTSASPPWRFREYRPAGGTPQTSVPSNYIETAGDMDGYWSFNFYLR